jgi:GTPase SAR1 family protein
MTGTEVLVMIVGCKTDQEDKRQVTFEQGEALANEIGALFMECSPKTGRNVNELFALLAEKLVD